MAVTAIGISAVVTAAATVTTGVINYEQGQQAAKAEKNLANQQATQLQQEQAQAAALQATEAVEGQTFGFPTDSAGGPGRAVVMTGLGFGQGGGSSPNAGSGAVTGMG